MDERARTGLFGYFKKEPEIVVQGELQSISSKLDELTRDIEVIKKAIEEKRIASWRLYEIPSKRQSCFTLQLFLQVTQ